MAVTHIYLKGGPCNGRTVSANQIVGGLVAYIKCGGGYYTDQGAGTRPNGNPIWSYAGKTQPGPPGGGGGGGGGAQYAPNVYRSWAHMEVSVNRHLPTSLHRIDYAMRRTLQGLRHRHRVR